MENLIQNKSTIELSGHLLTSAYGVYLIIISKDDNKYVYVGQTGDAKHLSARGPFYRIAAHFGYSKSTQNQVYKYLQGYLKTTHRALIEEWLHSADIKMTFYQTDEFEHLKETEDNKKNTHHPKRQNTLGLETALLGELKKISERSPQIFIMNKTFITFKGGNTAHQVTADAILKELQLI